MTRAKATSGGTNKPQAGTGPEGIRRYANGLDSAPSGESPEEARPGGDFELLHPRELSGQILHELREINRKLDILLRSRAPAAGRTHDRFTRIRALDKVAVPRL